MKQCNTPEKVTPQKTLDFLASSVTKATTCGSNESPWIIQAEPGQRINVSLLDFGWTKKLYKNHPCNNYGYILDVMTDAIINICGGTSREKHLYTSEGYIVQVVMTFPNDNNMSFLIGYQGN